MDWIVCPVVKLTNTIINALDKLIISLLEIDRKIVDENDPRAGSRYYGAWENFRNISLAILVIAALLMIIGQAIGIEILDAYTIKKILPRLLVAIIGIGISWYLMKWFVLFTNDLGFGVRSIIYYPFRDLDNGALLRPGDGFIITLLTVPAIVAFKIGGLLLFGASALLGLLIAVLVLIMRQLVIVVLLMAAPIAIACYILPNTQGIWKLWYESFTKALMMFPIIMAFLAVGRVFAQVSSGEDSTFVGQIVAFIAYILPYFLIPLTFRFAGGALRTIGGFTNDKSRGAFDRLKKARQNTLARNHQMRMSGQGMLGRGKVGNVYRRVASLNDPTSHAANVFTKRGRARFTDGANMRIQQAAANDALKRDDGNSTGDDDATWVAGQRGTKSRAQFVSGYVDRLQARAEKEGKAFDKKAATDQAYQALNTLENGLGLEVGSNAMRIAAYKAWANSTTGADGSAEGWKQRREFGVQMINDGLMNATDVMKEVKGNKARADGSGVGFGEGIAYFAEAARAARTNTAADTKIVPSDQDMLRKAVKGSGPGALIGGHKNAIKATMPVILEDLRVAGQERDRLLTIAQANPTTENQSAADAANRELKRQLAAVAGSLDVLSQVSPESAQLVSDGVLKHKLHDKSNFNIQQEIERNRGDQEFVQFRREYGSAAQGELGRQAAEQAAQGQPGRPINGPGVGFPK